MARDQDRPWQLATQDSVSAKGTQPSFNLAAQQAKADALLRSFNAADDPIVAQIIAEQQAASERLRALNQVPEWEVTPPEQAQPFQASPVVTDDSDIAALIGSTEAGAQPTRSGPGAAFSASPAVPNVGQPRAAAARRSLSGSGALVPDDEGITNTLASLGAGAARTAPVQTKEARKLPTQGKF